LREVRIAKKKAVEERILKKKKELAERKMREGRRLTLEELKILYGESDE